MSKKNKSKKRTKKVTSAPKVVKPEISMPEIPVPDSVKTDYPLSVYDESIYPTPESKPSKKLGFWKWLVGKVEIGEIMLGLFGTILVILLIVWLARRV